MIPITHFLFTSLVVPSCLAILVEVLSNRCIEFLPNCSFVGITCFIKHSAAATLNSRSKYTEGVAHICNIYDVIFQM